jgi:hypothetical protein
MMMIQVLTVFVIDLSGIMDSINAALFRFIFGRKRKYDDGVNLIPKPFSCSLCMTWWVCLIVIIASGELTLLNVTVAGLLAFFTPVTAGSMFFIRDVVAGLQNKITDKIFKN